MKIFYSISKFPAVHTWAKSIIILSSFMVWNGLIAQPVIHSFSPASGSLGTAVTISGSNFNPVPSNNIVFFGAVKAVVSAATDTSLTVTVPAGASYDPIAVINNSLIAYAAEPFVVTFPGYADVTQNSFGARIDSSANDGSANLKISDLDGDGKPDIVVSNFTKNTINICKNTSTSDSLSFASEINFATGKVPFGLVIADWNGDGKPDIATANFGSNTISVFENTSINGVISFAAKQDYAAGYDTHELSAGDFNGDGKTDIAVVNVADNTVSVYQNTSAAGHISFAARVNFGTGDTPDGVAIGDLDSDGRPDIVVSNKNSNTVSVFKNTGIGGAISFATKTDYATGTGPWNVFIADMDGDKKPDICTPNHYAYSFSIIKNTSLAGAISFAPKIDFSTGTNAPTNIAVNDINGDGSPDIALVNESEYSLSLFVHSSTRSEISFSSNTDFLLGSYNYPYGAAISDLNGDGMPEIINTNTEYTISLYKNLIRSQINRITGYVFEDANANGVKDSSEIYANDVRINSSKVNDEIFSIPANGYYTNHIDTGNYTTIITPYRTYYTVVPLLHSTSFTSYNNTDTLNIALQPIPGIKDLAVSIIPVISPRPGKPVQYKIYYQNKGTASISNALITFLLPSQLTYDSATPAQDFIKGDTLQWNLNTLAPREEGFILLYLLTKQPPVVNLGDFIYSKASITYAGNDTTPADNFFELRQRVISSFDPNDKTESHAGSIPASQVAEGAYLQYSVRFQNTGNDTAFNITVKDTLSPKLDWNSLEMVTATANYQLSVHEGACEWTFNNIDLVDSIHNEAKSHGYLVYRIKPKATVLTGDSIFNKAAIYFDFNLPVFTNSDTTIVVPAILPLHLLAFTAINKRGSTLLQWQTSKEISLDRFEVVRSVNGKEYNRIGSIKAGLTDYEFTDFKPLEGLNYYRLKMIDKDGKVEYSPARKINNRGSLYINIYPNPVKDRLQLEIISEVKTSLQIQVLTMDGKVILSTAWNVNEGTNMQKINTSHLQRGSYFLHATSKDNQQSVGKFEKM